MARHPSAWANPLDDPLALLVGAIAATGLAMLRAQHASRGDRLRDRRVRESIEGALQRANQLALQSDLVSGEAMARFQDPDHLDALGMVQLCCERLRLLPDRILQRRPLLESGGGILLSAEDLQARLSRARDELRRETSPTLRRERHQLVDQLTRNLDAARFGMDTREARLLGGCGICSSRWMPSGPAPKPAMPRWRRRSSRSTTPSIRSTGCSMPERIARAESRCRASRPSGCAVQASRLSRRLPLSVTITTSRSSNSKRA
jgi:hypothetical protein